MKSYDVIGYAFDADLHCPDCTAIRFPEGATTFTYDPFDGTQDSEGNAIHAVFADEGYNPDDGEEYRCGDCFVGLATGDLPAWVNDNPARYTELTGIEVTA